MSSLSATTADDFQAANRLYDAGRFAEAIAAYEKIDPRTAHVFYNLGNACFRTNQLGKAILNYERARRLQPRDPDILANLKFAQERLGVDAANRPPRAVARFMESAVLSRTLNEWGTYELAALWATLLAVALCIWWPRIRTVWVTAALAASLGFFATVSALAFRVGVERNSPTAVVIARNAEARFAPLADATVHFKLIEGTIVSIKEDRGQWQLIERADGQQGWIKSDVVERIGIP